MKAIQAIVNFIWVFIQRLVSNPTQAAAKSAYGELIQVVAIGGVLYAAIQSKNLQDILSQGDNLYIAITAFVGALATVWRNIFSSNLKAIANPTLPQITGDGTHPTNVPIPK